MLRRLSLSHFLPQTSLRKTHCEKLSCVRRIHFQNSRCSPARVRFAPSPTGQLHLGGFRTALLNYLFALKHGGQFILRIEDTDQTRLVPGALQNIETDLHWLGIEPAEGPNQPGKFGPYVQSQRLSLYEESLTQLLEYGHAYECFCTEKRLDLLRREALRLRQKPRYDNKCRDLTREDVKRKKLAGEQYCVRFKLSPEKVSFNDLVFGNVMFDLAESYEGDPVIMKSDGYPTYHFANVVDDHYMEVTHVLRGVEWQISTPKHLQLYRSFNWKPPEYAHLPLVLNQDGTKLSKRQGDVSIAHYRSVTYYPTALVNFVTKSGGGFSLVHDVERLYSMNELAENFELNGVSQGGCRLDFILLEKLNQIALETEIKNNIQVVTKSLIESLENRKIDVNDYSADYLEKILRWCPQRISKINDLVSSDFEYLWSRPSSKALSQITTNPEVLQRFIELCDSKIYGELNNVADSLDLSALLQDFSSANKLKHKTFLKDLRMILCGVTKGPPVVEVFQLLGKDLVCSRLETSIQTVAGTQSIKIQR